MSKVTIVQGPLSIVDHTYQFWIFQIGDEVNTHPYIVVSTDPTGTSNIVERAFGVDHIALIHGKMCRLAYTDQTAKDHMEYLSADGETYIPLTVKAAPSVTKRELEKLYQ